jgi:hypothetical protein
MPTAPSILVVGAGLTGAAVSRALRRSLPAESIIVWEALGAVGGRMQTERVSVEGGALGLADTGAQYVTVTDDAAVATAHDPLYNALLDAGILMPMVGRIEGTRSADGGGKNYIAPAGVAAIVEHLFRVAGVRPVLGRRATGLYRAPPVAGGGVGSGGGTPSPRGRWEVSAADGTRQAFDGVVLTQPAPHMLNLLDAGDGNAILADLAGKVEKLDLPADTKAGINGGAKDAWWDSAVPAYQRLLAEMQRQQAIAPTEDGIWRLPEGDKYYAALLASYTTPDLTADQIHDLGLKEVGRIHGEMRAIMAKVGFTGTLQEFYAFTRDDPRFFHTTR